MALLFSSAQKQDVPTRPPDWIELRTINGQSRGTSPLHARTQDGMRLVLLS